MTLVNLRHAARAIILDEADRILLCRFVFPHPITTLKSKIVWAAPGGGIEPGETTLAALRRELTEEVGFALTTDPPHVWHQQVTDPAHAPGYDGIINDYFLIRTTAFTPSGAFNEDELAAENLRGFQWWPLQAIVDYRGPDLFSPRDLATPLSALITQGVPETPALLGL